MTDTPPTDGSPGRSTDTPGGAQALPFAGRAAALEALEADRVEARRCLVIRHVVGRSGVGKSTFVSRFLGGLKDGEAVILRSTCHPGRARSHGMLYGVVAGLAHHLADAPLDGWTGSPVARAAGRLFPVLAERRMQPDTARGHLGELRRAGEQAVCELLVRIARRTPTIVWFDDVQWADPDSLDVLCRLGAWDVPLLVLLSYRKDMVPDGLPVGASLTLGPLTRDDVRALFDVHETGGGRSIDVDAVMAETRGLAIWVSQFHHYLRTRPDPANGISTLALGELLSRRLAALSPEQQRLVEVVALCRRPLELHVALAAAGVGREHVAGACAGAFLRREGRRGDRLGVFHDKVRLVTNRLSLLERKATHRSIAHVWQSEGGRAPADLAYHWAEAGEPERAAEHAERAGDVARERLALKVAAEHYRQAIAWRAQGPRQWMLHARLGEVHAGLGMGREAGDAFARAAALLEAGAGGAGFTPIAAGSDGPVDPALRRVHLRRRAAEQYFHAGQIDDALRIIQRVLHRLGLHLPTRRLTSLVRSIAFRLGVIAGGPWRRRGGDEVRFESLWTASTSLAHVNHGIADAFVARSVWEARRLGDHRRLLRALAYEASAMVTIGSGFFDRQAVTMMAEAEALLEQDPEPYDLGWFATCKAAQATFRARWRETVHFAGQAEQHYRRVGVGVHWERAVNAGYRMAALAMIGDLPALDVLQAEVREGALARNDPLALNLTRSGHPAVIQLYRDDAEAAKRDAADQLDGACRRTGRWPDDVFRTPDYHNLVADAQRALYDDRASDAYARVEDAWPLVRQALLLHVRYVRADLRYLRGRAALAAARVLTGHARRRCLRVASRMARALRRDRGSCSRAYAAALACGLGRRPGEALARAKALFEELDMTVHHASAALHAAAHRGDWAGVETATEVLRALGIADAGRTAAMLIPSPGVRAG